ncbi:MAG: DUF47 family protein [Candidatus Thorarchaeota archaeon]|nr:DUF47 family protein [Candidatus Thorarchaeota archaeon]MCK5239631.1 DUF47 family protein [Candidatus Thorarchaeota archaeon]
MGTFSRIFGSEDKDLQKKADELLLKLSKGFQSASAKLCVAAECWEEGKKDVLKELQEEIIELEREMDEVKEELVENVLTKSAFMPQAALERHTLVKALDKVIDATENPIRIMVMGIDMKPPSEIREIGKKVWQCTDLLQDAVKNLYKDFKKAIEITRKLDILREETRDIQFELLGKLYNDPKFKPTEIILFQSVSERMVHVAQRAEDAGDYIRELAVKYS